MSTLLKIGALAIPNRAALDLDQTYETLGGETILRTVSGAAFFAAASIRFSWIARALSMSM